MINNKRKYYDVLYEYNVNKRDQREKKEKKQKKDDETSSSESSENDLSSLLSKKGKDTKIERDNNHIYFQELLNFFQSQLSRHNKNDYDFHNYF